MVSSAFPFLLLPFAAQFLLAVVAFAVAPRIARAPRVVWGSVCAVALGVLLIWPLMRVFPVVPIELLGARVVACIELTLLAVPAVLFFAIAARHVPRKSDGRAMMMLTAVAAVYFVKAGWWMIVPVGVGSAGSEIGKTRTNLQADGSEICRQSTDYTCVAASMVTMLRARGIGSEEAEMARLSFTQVGGGATDSRAMWALEEKLKGTSLVVRYRNLDVRGLIDAPKPCMVQLDWGYFISHMVPVMSADAENVVIGDPLNGYTKMAAAAFSAKWKGMAIVLEKREGASEVQR